MVPLLLCLWSRCYLDFVLLVMERSEFGLMIEIHAPVRLDAHDNHDRTISYTRIKND